jgi:hypothetical protein
MDTADKLRTRSVLDGRAFSLASLASRAGGMAGCRDRILTRGGRREPAALASDNLSLLGALYRPEPASAW